MGKVVTYKNDKFRCFCQIKLDGGERILISIASSPSPSVKVSKLGLGGLLPTKTIWEFTPTMAGGYDVYIRKLIAMFADAEKDSIQHLLDAIRDKLLPCNSIDEVIRVLLSAERGASIEYKKDIEEERCKLRRNTKNIKAQIITEEEMWDIISAYRAVLEEKGEKGQVYTSELLLPHPKEIIIQALRQALLTVKDKETIDNLSAAYISLADFLPEPDGSIAISLNQQFQDLNQNYSTTKEEFKGLLSTSGSIFEQMERISKIASDESHRLLEEVKRIKDKKK